LHNIDLIPDTYKSIYNRYKPLSERFLINPIDHVECIVFDDRAEAHKWIKLKHTGENDGVGVVSWNAQQKARFDQSVEGKSALSMQLLDFLNAQESVEQSVKDDLKNVPITSLERLVGDPDVRRAIGIGVDKGEVVANYLPEQIIKPLVKIVKDLIRSDFGVKEIYYKADRKAYLEKFGKDELPERGTELGGYWKISSTPPSAKSNVDSDKGTGSSTSGRGKSADTSRSTVIPKKPKITIGEVRINKIYNELTKLKVAEYPNAASVLFRVFIELSVDTYIEQHECLNEKKERITVDAKLAQKIKSVLSDFNTRGRYDKHKFKGINVAINDTDDVTSINTMNAYVHNKDFQPNADKLKHSWDQISPFIYQLWELI